MCYGWSCRRDSVPNDKSSVSERRVLWAELSIACARIGVAEVIFTPPPPSILRFGNCLFICFFDFVSNEYVSWFAGYKMRTMLCIIVLSLCLLRCFKLYPKLVLSNFPISNSSCLYVRLGFIILTRICWKILNMLYCYLISEVRLSRFFWSGTLGKCAILTYFFETYRLRKVRELPIVLLVI